MTAAKKRGLAVCAAVLAILAIGAFLFIYARERRSPSYHGSFVLEDCGGAFEWKFI